MKTKQNSVPLFITSEMERYGETGVQTHFNGFLGYAEEHEWPATFIGPDEAWRAYLHLRLLTGLLRRGVLLEPALFYASMRQMSFYTVRRELKRRLANTSAWCVYAQDPISALAALSLRRLPSQRVVLAIHYNRSQAEEMSNRGIIRKDSWSYRMMQRQERTVLQGVDHVVVFSAYMRDKIQAVVHGGQLMTVIPNTADTPSLKAGVVPRDLISIGSLEPRKNQQFLLNVLAEAKRSGKCYTLTLIGSGEDMAHLKALTNKLGLDEQVFFLGRQANAATYLGAHKALVHAALVENLPIALIEALAVGMPILAPAVGGIPEVFSDGKEGFFWSLDDIEGSATRLISIMEDEPLRLQMGNNARQRYLAHFERSKVFAKLAEVVYSSGAAIQKL